jgi:cell division protein FtsB
LIGSSTSGLKLFRESFNVARMKRILSLTTVLLALQLPCFAQTTSTAAALADRQDAEERYKRMASDVEALQAANQSLQKRINALEEHLSKLGEDVAKANSNSSVRDDLKVLRDKIQEVDKKRETDKQVISDEVKKALADVEKAVLKAGSARPAPVRESRPVKEKVEETATAAAPEKGYSYTIQEGDTLSAIVQAYNKKFQSEGMKKIKQGDVEQANPKVNWNRLRVGQKIVIPAPVS